jgi:hypothetical protein
MTAPVYTFGNFQLNNSSNGLGYFLVAKQLPLPVVKPVTFNIARRDGLKKSGEAVEARTITVKLVVVGTSRIDLISRIDALQAALSLRSQQLCIHEDGRFYQSADAISGTLDFAAGKGIVHCEVICAFTAYDPYAYASTASSYDTGVLALSASGGPWVFPQINIAGGGTVYSLPFIRIANKTSSGSTTLSATLTSGTLYTAISVVATTFSASLGDQVTITHGVTVQTLVIAAGFAIGATSITVSGFTASANYAIGDVAAKVTQWTSLTIAQTNDNQTLTASSSPAAPLPNLNGQYVDIQCDSASANAGIQANSSGVYIEPLGLFPVLEPVTTSITITLVSASAVSAEATITWVPRYAS